MKFYDLDGNETDRDTWIALFEDTAGRIIEQTTVGPYWISTVWLGLDHSFGHSDEPWLWETMVFRKSEDGPTDFMSAHDGVEQIRHASREQAMYWHGRWVAQAEALVAAGVEEAEVE